MTEGGVTARERAGALASRFASDYGIVLALILLCVYFSWATYADQHPVGAAAGSQLARRILDRGGGAVLIVARDTREDAEFARALTLDLFEGNLSDVGTVQGQPSDARRELDRVAATGKKLDVIACTQTTASWAVFDDLAAKYPSLAGVRVMTPQSYRWSNFLKTDNLLNIANQITVIAIIAIGMTLVIITGGIDLSVGSLIALSAVATTLLIRNAGGVSAPTGAMIGGSLAGIALCGAVGLLSGVMVAIVRIPAFIVTLGMMLVASGIAFILARGQSIYQVPDAFVWLGRGTSFGLPVAVILMLGLYIAAHVFLTRTALGRHIYAVGSNQEAARLSGVPVKRTLLFVYVVSGLLAGLGGVVMASQLKSGAPTYGQMYELYVIAAAVVGGTSLAGGEGKAFGTLIGALIIAVIQNGMNLTGVESYTQKVVLGLVILGAVTLDVLKRRGVGRWGAKLLGL
jgi:ribose transport system permease protein